MTVARRIIQRRNSNSKEKEQMTELAKRFIDKKCVIYSLNDNQITGVIKEVSEGALLVEKDGNIQAVNLDFIVRIREYPTKKNGKEKSVILD
jgi:nitrogen regulatory protein PII